MLCHMTISQGSLFHLVTFQFFFSIATIRLFLSLFEQKKVHPEGGRTKKDTKADEASNQIFVICYMTFQKEKDESKGKAREDRD